VLSGAVKLVGDVAEITNGSGISTVAFGRLKYQPHEA
jgi:hypothetical protein